MRQVANQPVMQREPVLRHTRGTDLDLHPRHVDAGRAFAPAGLAGDAELHRLRHLVGRQSVGPKLPADGEPQRVGAPARHVALVAGHAIARAHHAALERAAGAVVVAHLDRALETAAGARIGRPVELRGHVVGVIVRAVAQQAAVVELRRAHDLAGIEQALRVETVLHLLEGAHQFLAEHLLVELRSHDAVAVFAGMRALVGAHEVERLFGDRAHRLDVLVEPKIEHRPHVQAADRGMRVPGAARAVFLENRGEPVGIVGEMIERHRAILDEGNRFALLLHRHHDVEAGGAHFGDRGLQLGIEHLDHAALLCARLVPADAKIADQFDESHQAADVFVPVVFGEFDEQDRVRDRHAQRPRSSAETSRSRAPAPASSDRPVRPRSARA